jgi:cell filamentation protein
VEQADPYCWPGTRVLRNKLSLRDAEELAAAEAQIVQVRDVAAAASLVAGAYDLAHLRRFHKRLFSDVYAWAGEIRTVEIARTHPFARVAAIADYAATVFAALKVENHLLGLKQEPFTERLAHHLGEVNTIHPFREGNGRTQRAFFRQLAAAAGWRLDWSKLSKADNDAACQFALVQGDHSQLAAVLAPAVSRIESG